VVRYPGYPVPGRETAPHIVAAIWQDRKTIVLRSQRGGGEGYVTGVYPEEEYERLVAELVRLEREVRARGPFPRVVDAASDHLRWNHDGEVLEVADSVPHRQGTTFDRILNSLSGTLLLDTKAVENAPDPTSLLGPDTETRLEKEGY
jgi:hypothetical protein